MGRSLKMRVVAEGVETQEELSFLQAHQCEEAQGYYFSRPVLPRRVRQVARDRQRSALPASLPIPVPTRSLFTSTAASCTPIARPRTPLKLQDPQAMIDRRLDGSSVRNANEIYWRIARESFAASLRRADGASVYVEIAASPISMNGHGGTLLVCRDVTERVTLEHELLDVATREQARLAHDLHDGLGQQLTGIALYLRGLGGQMGREMPAHAADIARLEGLVAKAIEDTRRLASGMSPLAVGREGLASALIALSAQARELYGLRVVLDIDPLIDTPIETQVASQLYRIVQEATSNAARHARATSIEIAVQLADSRLTLVIADDGIGMAESLQSRGRAAGLGLRIMRYRAERIGGAFQIERRSPGTAIRVSFPLSARRPPAP